MERDRICSQCGAVLEVYMRYCPLCGTAVVSSKRFLEEQSLGKNRADEQENLLLIKVGEKVQENLPLIKVEENEQDKLPLIKVE